MIRRLLFVAAAMAALDAAPAAAQLAPPGEDEASPVWRSDLTHLGDDGATIASCFTSAAQHNDADEAACLHVVQDSCLAAMGEDAAATSAGARSCSWRAIAAWEEVLETSVDDLRATLGEPAKGEFEDSEIAWQTFLRANVRALSAPYAGGSLEGVVAAEVRARNVAERAIELRAFRRSLQP